MKKLVIPTIIALVALLAGCNSQAVDDSAITAKVKSKLATDSDTSAIRISVETKEGVVTLTGNVPTDTEKSKAETLAKNTDGVKRVQNEIKVTPESSSTKDVGDSLSDAAILAKLKAKLLADGITGTDVDVNNGAVVLKGQVDDPQKKSKAEELAKNTSGVKDVKNELTIKKYKSS
jgi:hyperosmotically inducible periplasmic protein